MHTLSPAKISNCKSPAKTIAKVSSLAIASGLPENSISRENPEEIIAKLNKIAIPTNLNPNFVQQAKHLFSQFQSKPYEFYPSQCNKLLTQSHDNDARKIIQKCERIFRKWTPIDILADGNCGFNSVAMFCCGSHSRNTSLRLRIVVVSELLFNKNQYINDIKLYCQSDDPEFIRDEIRSEMRCAAIEFKWCGFVTFAAMATVVSHPIRFIYPISDVPTESGHAYNSHNMNKTLYPMRRGSNFNTIFILCSGNANILALDPPKWKFNHFVLVLDPNATSGPSEGDSSQSSVTAPSALASAAAPSTLASAAAPSAFAFFPLSPIIEDCKTSNNLLDVTNLFIQTSPSNSSLKDSSSSLHSAGSNASRQFALGPYAYALDKESNLFALYPPPNTTPSLQAVEAPLRTSQDSLLPGAFLLTGSKLMSALAIFDILSSPNIVQKSVKRIPSALKSNCYFILNLGVELTEFEKAKDNRLKIQDRLRDGTGSWTEFSANNTTCFIVDGGLLKSVEVNAKKNKLKKFDLREHRATYTYKDKDNELPSRRTYFGFGIRRSRSLLDLLSGPIWVLQMRHVLMAIQRRKLQILNDHRMRPSELIGIGTQSEGWIFIMIICYAPPALIRLLT